MDCAAERTKSLLWNKRNCRSYRRENGKTTVGNEKLRIVPQKERKVYCGKREIADRTAERTENLPQEIKNPQFCRREMPPPVRKSSEPSRKPLCNRNHPESRSCMTAPHLVSDIVSRMLKGLLLWHRRFRHTHAPRVKKTVLREGIWEKCAE